MISNLLTALGVAVLSMQTPTAQPTAEPMRAYYDASQVAEYGTTNNKVYNYSSYTLTDEENTFQASEGENTNFEWVNNPGHTALELAVGPDSYNLLIIGTSHALDLYGDGELIGTFEGDYNQSLNGCFYFRNIDLSYSSVSYLWIFDHQEPPMSQTIIETAGDATTAAAAVIGAGFTGVINLFYNDGITGLGILALITVGASLVWFALALILRLWRGRR